MRKFVMFAAIFFAFVSPSLAGFDVCNRSRAKVSVAIGYFDKQYRWMSAGWWQIEPTNCESVLTGDLNGRYYYIYAEDTDKRVWRAKKEQKGGFFCVKYAKFTLHNSDFETNNKINCENNGASTKQFRLVDTNNNNDFVYRLND